MFHVKVLIPSVQPCRERVEGLARLSVEAFMTQTGCDIIWVRMLEPWRQATEVVPENSCSKAAAAGASTKLGVS
jgi:hypothetical protein